MGRCQFQTNQKLFLFNTQKCALVFFSSMCSQWSVWVFVVGKTLNAVFFIRFSFLSLHNISFVKSVPLLSFQHLFCRNTISFYFHGFFFDFTAAFFHSLELAYTLVGLQLFCFNSVRNPCTMLLLFLLLVFFSLYRHFSLSTISKTVIGSMKETGYSFFCYSSYFFLRAVLCVYVPSSGPASALWNAVTTEWKLSNNIFTLKYGHVKYSLRFVSFNLLSFICFIHGISFFGGSFFYSRLLTPLWL